MLKFIKKATSALLASIMCIPAGIVNVTSAAQSNPDGSYTVTLTDTENGLIQFSEESMANSSASQEGYQMMHINDDGEMEQVENDGSLWAFKEGDTVEIECIPDDGYYVESLTLKDSESGNELAKKDTLNNVFSFEMPAKNLSVEAKFSSTAVIDINNTKSKSSDEIEYHDITEDIENEDLSISTQEINETVSDLISENYIKSHLNPKYVTVDSDDIRMANVLLVKNTIFDGQYVEENDTIDSIMGSVENGTKDMDANAQKFIAQLESHVVVYDFNASSDYYVAYANTLMKDSSYTVQDLCVAINNNDGIVIENGYVYDEETGLLYIPKDLYKSKDEKDKDIFLYLQIQFMQVFNHKGRKNDGSIPDGMTSGVNSISVDEEEEQIELSSYNQEIFAMQTDIQADKGMDPDNLNVLVNGLPADKDAYTYDPETGEMTIEGSPASITSVEVTEGENSLSDELLDFIDKTDIPQFPNLYR